MDDKALEDAILQVKMDASNVNLAHDDGEAVAAYLSQASEHAQSARMEPAKSKEHLKLGFACVGKVRGILGQSAVQSTSFRRHQWPFLPPEAGSKSD